MARYTLATGTNRPPSNPQPVDNDRPENNEGLANFGRFLSGLNATRSVGGFLNQQFNDPKVGDFTSGALNSLGALSGFGGAFLNSMYGNPVGASLSGIGGLGQTARLAQGVFSPGSNLGNFLNVTPNAGIASTLGTAGGALGAVGGLAGAGLSFSQGNIAQGLPSLISGVGSLASLAPAGATLGGVSIAGGAGAGATAAGAGGAGAGIGAGAATASIAAAASAVGLTATLGIITHMIAKLFDNPGPGANFANWTDYASFRKGEMIGDKISHALQTMPASSFGNVVAGMSQKLSPHGEVQFGFGKELFAGNSPEEQSQQYKDFAARISNPQTIATDPGAIKNAIANVWVQKGRGGVVPFEENMTRLVRGRMLAGLPRDEYWNAFRQQILNSEVVDAHHFPEKVSKALAQAPQYPVEADAIYVGKYRLPLDHKYVTTAGEQMPAELVGIAMMRNPETTVYNATTKEWVNQDNKKYFLDSLPDSPGLMNARREYELNQQQMAYLAKLANQIQPYVGFGAG